MKRRCVAALLILLGAQATHAQDQRFLVIILDGLRPDYVTQDLMPNLYALAEGGVHFQNHHAVFPTVTRVNSASLSTGSYPETHGLMGNSVYFPEVDPDRALSTSDHRNLIKINEATGGNLLTATTLGEVLEANGLKMLALSSGSTGSAMLMNHTLAGEGVINVGVILPESNTARVHAAIGPAPEDSVPAYTRNAWVVDAYIKIALDDTQPDVTYMWLTDPDHTAHEHGIGAPETNNAIRGVDRELGRILAAHTERNLTDTVNIMVTSDHGFSTHIGGFNIMKLLREKGLDEGVVVAGGAIYVKNSPKEQIRNIAKALQEAPGVGPIFSSQSETPEGWVPGTISFHSIHWQHNRSADLYASPAWNDKANEFGYKGQSTAGGVAGHGSASAFDIHNTLIASGPDFLRDRIRNRPTSNVDIAPTILHLLKIDPPQSMKGRPIIEALSDPPPPRGSSLPTTTWSDRVHTDDYNVEINRTIEEEYLYFNYATVKR